MTKSNVLTAVITLLVCLGIFGVYKRNMNSKIELYEHNLITAKDSVEYYKLENGNMMAEKNSFILTEKELREELDISKSQLREYRRKLGDKVAYISKLEGQIQTGPVITTKDSIVYVKDSIESVYWKYEDKWLAIDGESNISKRQTSIYNVTMPVPVKVGLTDDYKIFVESENPYLTITDIKGAVIDKSNLRRPKPKVTHGLYVGFGGQYGLINKEFDVGPQFGYGFAVNF